MGARGSGLGVTQLGSDLPVVAKLKAPSNPLSCSQRWGVVEGHEKFRRTWGRGMTPISRRVPFRVAFM